MTQTCEIKTRLTLLTKSFCSRIGIQTTPLDAALRLSDAEVVKDLYQLWLEAGHEGTLDDFLLTFKGDQGDSNYQLWLDEGNAGTVEDFFATLHGKDIELRLSETHIQWKYVQDGEETWTNLIAREDLKGDEIQIGVTETHIIWKYSNETVWNNLISLAEITGPQGEQGYSLQFTWDGTSLGIKREDEIEYQYSNLKGDQGIQGIAGREVVFQTSETHIQWKYADEVEWNDLISLAEIMGPQGIQGIAGREVQIQSDDTYIQWKYADEVEWNNIVLLESLRGPQGIQGIAGSEVEMQNSGTHIQWRYVGDETWNDIIAISTITGVDGIDGEEIQLQKSLTHIQYKYESDVEWTDLVALADLKGDAGEQIQLQVNETHIQWKYTSDIEWTDLIALSALTGEQGIQGIAGEEILLQNNGTHVQWKYESDVEWIDLVDISTLTGADGQDGLPGEKVELRVNDNYIEYKYESDVEWTQLFDLSQLQGADGQDGLSAYEIWLNNGGFGTEAVFLTSLVGFKYRADEWVETAQYTIGEVININGNSYACKTDHTAELNNRPESGTFWDSYWFLMAKGGLSAYEIWLNNGGSGTEQDFLNSLQGEDGQIGADGEQIQIQVNATHIQWKYTSDVTWNDLIALSEITGADGVAGADGSDGNTIISGTSDPTDEGSDGDFYINTSTLQIFGPKTSGVWGTGTNLKGADGAIGPTFSISKDHFFADATARDAYFTSNPSELVAGVVISNEAGSTSYQQYSGSAWIDKEFAVGGGGTAVEPHWFGPYSQGERRFLMTASATGSYSGTPSNVLSFSVNGFYWSNGNTAATITFTFPELVRVTGIMIQQDIATAEGTWKVEGSTDGSSWTEIATSLAWGGVLHTVWEFTNGDYYLHYRLSQTAGTTNNAPYIQAFVFKTAVQPS